MNLTDYRAQIDDIDKALVDLLEKRMDVAAGIAAWKQANGAAVQDTGREAVKYAAVHSLCRPETADLITEVFQGILAASRSYQTQYMEKNDGK